MRMVMFINGELEFKDLSGKPIDDESGTVFSKH